MASRRAFNTVIGFLLIAGAVTFVLLLSGVDLGLLSNRPYAVRAERDSSHSSGVISTSRAFEP